MSHFSTKVARPPSRFHRHDDGSTWDGPPTRMIVFGVGMDRWFCTLSKNPALYKKSLSCSEREMDAACVAFLLNPNFAVVVIPFVRLGLAASQLEDIQQVFANRAHGGFQNLGKSSRQNFILSLRDLLQYT